MKKIIYGINPVFEALNSKDSIITDIIVQSGKENKRVQQIIDLAVKKAISVRYEDKNAFNNICNENHQGVIAHISRFDYKNFDDLMEELNDAADSKLLFLDCIEDPHNLGAVIRSAAAFGFDGIVVPENKSAHVTAAVIKTSSGAVFHIPVCLVKNLSMALNSAKDNGFWSVGLVVDSDKFLHDLDLKMKVALVIGNEEKGLRTLVAKNCDFLAKIPISKKVNSLNASAAGACAMYEVVRQNL